ncbi:MnhB domain-containing protein [Haliea sp. E1-2-M8]|uniref:MnhB domain-containing protein n=1 Tax=Haliea sp. E1-2-M8 TaxID=3064706 RepID=UPI002717BD8D|nr:MnhB domain-containing protein [Haliea sp. E1-2-M8]MDO8863098.1 MnhB domain-containing protein [Haliea sp. E1-2-M8]
MRRRLLLFLTLAACAGFTVALAAAVLHAAGAALPSALPEQLAASLGSSGVEHPVTAVLLNFRNYDTLLEIGVLVIAGMVGISLASTSSLEDPALRSSDSLLYALQRWFVPLMLLLALYLLWAGADRPGGAFQAGAVLAATGVLMRLGGLPMEFVRPGVLLRLGLVLGFAVFLLVAVAGALAGEAFLAYPPGMAGGLILTIEIVLTLSIGMILLALFVAAPVSDEHEPEEGAGP